MLPAFIFLMKLTIRRREYYESFKKRRKNSIEDLRDLFTAFNGMKQISMN